jgi:hypothetical protein
MTKLPDVDVPLDVTLFVAGPRPDDHNACLNFGWAEWGGYALGYRRAALLAVQHVIATDTDHDTLVYPIVYLYRHAIELYLKEVIQRGRRLLDLPENFRATHDLQPLYDAARKIAEQVMGGKVPDWLFAMDRQMAELARVDATSMTFRYPVERDGSQSAPSPFDRFSLRHFAECAECLCDVLDGWTTGIDAHLEWKAEMAECEPS